MSSGHHLKLCLTAGSILIYGVAGDGAAEAADAFGMRPQSTYFLGASNAGAAAGGDVSSVIWNSAATTVAPGLNSSSSYTAIAVSLDETAYGGKFVEAGLRRTTDSGTTRAAAASVYTYQINDQLYAGLAMYAPFGLVTKPDNYWAGSPAASTQRIFSVDVNPTLGYKITPNLSIGVGVQALYYQTRLNSGAFGSVAGTAFRGDDWGVGGTAGLLWEVVPGTSVGIGYRSAVSLELDGSYRGPGVYTRATLDQTMPDQVTWSLRHAVLPGFTLLGTAQWENWSRIDNLVVTSNSGAGTVINLNLRDSWYFAVGAEYQYSPDITIRAGVGYDSSPVTDFNRNPGLPDSNNVLLSLGGSYNWSQSIRLDAAYAHAFFDDAPFCIGDGAGTSHCVSSEQAVLVRGSSDNSADVFSVGLKYSLVPAVELEPYK
ncbi:OmpP1/FadL family transporter [Rhodomicrobium udaipurense]|uniref:Outer membrane protein transport protein n=1 Tax=Rhodomicrobium udaipurense TaxID=1202716 RepID=A0A8I1KKJ9_9HYPH|nr:outer membrane protein transport protein [Rhodomicrobium udaipurense]MBJ7545037.1 outer membrane protein transport protein [Rhodomicrobium udaipurense]